MSPPVDEVRIEAWPPLANSGGMIAGTSSGIKITHLPSGASVVVNHHRRQLDNKNEALARLAKLIKTP